MAFHRLIKWKLKSNSVQNPPLLCFFSTSDSKPTTADLDVSSSPEPANTTGPQSSYPTFFNELRANLKNQPQQPQPNSQSFQSRRSTSPSFTSTNTLHKSTLKVEEISKKLSKFRHPSAVSRADSGVTSSSTSESPSMKHQPNETLFQDLYKRKLSEKSDMSKVNGQMSLGKVGETLSFDRIRGSLRKSFIDGQNVRRNVNVDRFSLPSVQNSFNLKASDAVQGSKEVGGKGILPESVFGREMRRKTEGEESLAMKNELLRIYSFRDLGQRLKELRPEVKEGNWFSLQDLSERLSKLRKIDETEAESANSSYRELKNTMLVLCGIKEDKIQKSPFQRFDLHGLGQMGRTPDYMLSSPKEHLVEMYFHPDNMSSAEKLKIELTKVREEFKMSESDCGSSRVQVAQLTTKIKHLSSVLHKKDKHSRKGLEEMVQRRKKLLKYLRRTDWDSYCFVISKLGLRDNPISRA